MEKDELSTVKIAYLGPKGTFSEKAALAMNSDVTNLQKIEKATLSEVVRAVYSGEADRGIVPLRTDYGDVNDTLDTLHRVIVQKEMDQPQGRDVYITGYAEMPIKFYLAAKPGTKIEDIKLIATKKQAIEACVEDLDELVPGYTALHTDSTTKGAEMASQSHESGIGTLCSADAASKYGLVSLLERAITRTTRFIRIDSKMYTGDQQDESALMIRLYQDRPGLLHSITGAILPVNMTDIHLMKSKRDIHGVAGIVFLIRMMADIVTAEAVISCLQSELGKEGLYGVKNRNIPIVNLLGTYPVMNLSA